MIKVICAGYPKTGTKSLAKALRILGYDKVYDFEEAIEFGFDEWEKVLNGTSIDVDEVLDKVYSENVEAVVDFPHSYFVDEFSRKWPNAKIILATRDTGWFESIQNMIETTQRNHFILFCMVMISKTSQRFKTWADNMFRIAFGCAEPNRLIWTTAYKRHNAYVRSLIPKERLLEYQVQQGWEPICRFLGKDVPAKEFPFENKADAQDGIAERVIENSRIVKQIKKEVILAMLFLSILFTTLICVLILCC